MKKTLTLIFLLLVKFLYAQPGENEFVNSRIREIYSITNSLAKNPTNYPLIWARTELIFRPFFSMYTRPDFTAASDTTYYITSALYELSAFKFKEIDILNDLNKLINNSDVLDVPGFGTGINQAPKTVNKANFYFKRGQYFYLKNNRKKAIEDYLSGINSNPDKETKQSICIAIAAYYFNLNIEPSTTVTFSQTNLEKALVYMDMIAPQFDKAIVDFPSKKHIDYLSHYEQEKLQLLEMTNQYNRLANFHINKTYSLFNLYNKLIDESKIAKKENTDDIKRILGFAIESLSESKKYLSPQKIDFKVTTE